MPSMSPVTMFMTNEFQFQQKKKTRISIINISYWSITNEGCQWASQAGVPTNTSLESNVRGTCLRDPIRIESERQKRFRSSRVFLFHLLLLNCVFIFLSSRPKFQRVNPPSNTVPTCSMQLRCKFCAILKTWISPE